MIGGRSALLAAAGGGLGYGNWTGNYSDVSLLLRNGTPALIPLDESPTPKNILITGSASVSTARSKYGDSSIAFDGDGDCVETPGSTDFQLGSNDFTIETWVWFNTLDTNTTLARTDAGSGFNGILLFHQSTGGLYVTSTGTSWNMISTANAYTGVTTNTWHHLALTRQGNTFRAFRDGILTYTITVAGSIFQSSNIVRIGSAQPGGAVAMNGFIDDFRITKGVARYTSDFSSSLPAELPANITDDPSYNSVSLLLRNGGTPSGLLIPLDESPTPKAITTSGNAGISTTTFKYGGSSLVFDGGGDHLSIPFDAGFEFGTGDFTVEGWFYFVDINTTSRGIVALGDGANVSGPVTNSWGLQYLGSEGSNQIAFSRYDGTTAFQYTTTGVSVTPNSWHHIAVCRGSGILRIFFNGVSYYSASNAVNYSVINTSNPLRVALQYYGPQGTYNGPRYWNGYIDDLRITKGVARYTKNFLPPPAELPAI